MGSKIKLSPTMQAAMWNAAGVRVDLMPTEMRRVARKGVRTGTSYALASRGLTEPDQPWILTDAGRAWIAEQVEAAHVEALWANLDRAQHLSPREATGCAKTDQAERMLLRAGEQVGIMIPADFAEWDHAEALAINEAWDRLHTVGAEGARIDRWHTAQAGLTFDEAVDRDHTEAIYIDATARERDDDSGSKSIRNGRQIAWLDMRRAQGCQTLGDAIAADYDEALDEWLDREIDRATAEQAVA